MALMLRWTGACGRGGCGRYAALLGTAHFDGFVAHLLASDRVQGLLTATLAAGRFEHADALLAQYARASPPAAAALAAPLRERDLGARLHACCDALGYAACVQLLTAADA